MDSGPVTFPDESSRAPDSIVNRDRTFDVVTTIVIHQRGMEEMNTP